MRKAAVLALLCAFGCGDDGGNGPGLDGTWTADDPGYECAHGLTFRGDHYVLEYVCLLDDDTVGLQVERGTFTRDDDGHTEFVPESSTCPGGRGPWSASVVIKEGFLRVSTSTGLIVLEPQDEPPPANGGVATYGCFDDDGYFNEHPESAVR